MRPRISKTCLHCGAIVKRTLNTYCSNKCQAAYRNNQYIAQWVAGAKSGGTNKNNLSREVRKWLFAQSDSCAICGLSEWRGQPIPRLADHIDGDYTNNRPENIRIICHNCDALLPTYKNRNKGRGRFTRRQRYAEGKSY